jgi:hypothetical protein
MARGGNMIVTLVAQTKKFQDGLKSAGDRARGFGAVVGGAMNMALGALGMLAGALVFFLPNFIKMGEEARKSELRLSNIAKQMNLFGESTEAVTGRISKYAEELSFATGVDDEMIRSAQAVMLTFKNLAKSADEVGGPFDRATQASLDLAAAGFGSVEENAVRLGKALQDPIKGITALTRVGVTLTDEQKANIEALMAQNDLLGAQSIILEAIETQVGGTAEATASATDKMNAKFESVVEGLSVALLPAIDTIATQMMDWLNSVEGQTAIQDLTDQMVAFGEWVASPEGKEAIDGLVTTITLLAQEMGNAAGKIKILADWAKSAAQWMDSLNQSIINFGGGGILGELLLNLTPRNGGNTGGTGGYRGQNGTTVNVTGLTPSSSIARTVSSAVNTANRQGVR